MREEDNEMQLPYFNSIKVRLKQTNTKDDNSIFYISIP